jgi:hypothetical protein
MIIIRWVLPIAMVAVGIAILFGWILQNLPAQTALRPMIGIVAILLGVHRFVASRIMSADDRRRFGGGRKRPWEKP